MWPARPSTWWITFPLVARQWPGFGYLENAEDIIRNPQKTAWLGYGHDMLEKLLEISYFDYLEFLQRAHVVPWDYTRVEGSSVHVKSGSFVHVRRLVVCARFCCVILSLYLCNMILLLAFFKTSSHNSSSYVFFLTSLCEAFAFRFVFLAFSIMKEQCV